MPEKKTRRLAAILFTDIAGYTRLMQESEARASEVRRRHREVFEHHHEQFNGQILQYYGDGTLSIFDSCVDAVQCAVAMQQELQEAPQVPLRIGIHLGDIVIADKDVYGNGVNVAARVESLGRPNAVLISGDVRKQVKNHEIETVSMGRFAMKNVAEPVEVFAVKAPGLTVPKADELEGKASRLKPAASSLSKTGRWIRLAAFGFVAMALGATLFWSLIGGQHAQSQLLSEDIREKKVAVAIFENLTGDEDLDVLGYLASEWITIGLQEIGVNTLTPEMIRQYKDYIGIYPNDPEGRPSFAEVTKAQYLISGSYLPKGDSLQLITRLTDTQTGEPVQQFPVFKAPKDQKENLVEEARKRLMGYWAIEKDQYFPKIKPPKYEAYQKFLACVGGNAYCHQEVLAMDSTFILNHIRLMFSYVHGNYDSLFHVSETYVRAHWEECTTYEKNFYTFTKEFRKGDYEAAYAAMKLNYDQEPREVFMAIETALHATFFLMRPKMAYPIFDKLFAEYDLFRDKLEPGQFTWYLETLLRLKRFHELIDFVEGLPKSDWIEKAESAAWGQLYFAYLETGQTEKALAYMEELRKRRGGVLTIRKAATIWSTVFQDTIDNPFHEPLRQRVDERPSFASSKSWFLWTSSEYLYYVLGEWEKAEKQFLALLDAEWAPKEKGWEKVYRGNMKPRIEAMLGAIYARQGKTAKALAQVDKLEQYRTNLKENISPHHKGFISWDQARIHAVLGNKEMAVKLLKQSVDEGRMIGGNMNMSPVTEMDLAGLRGYAPFERLVEGPE